MLPIFPRLREVLIFSSSCPNLHHHPIDVPSVLAPDFHFCLLFRTFHLYLPTGHSSSSNAFASFALPMYVLGKGTDSPFFLETFCRHPLLSSEAPRLHCTDVTNRQSLRLCMHLLWPTCLSLEDSAPHPPLFLIFLNPQPQIHLGREMFRNHLGSMATDQGAAAKQLEQIKPRPNVNFLGDSSSWVSVPGLRKAKVSGHQIQISRPTNQF